MNLNPMGIDPRGIDPVTGARLDRPGYFPPAVYLRAPIPPRIQVTMHAEGDIARALRAAFDNYSEVTLTGGFVQEVADVPSENNNMQGFTIEFSNMELNTRVDIPAPLRHIERWNMNVVVNKEGVRFEAKEEPVKKKSRYDLIKEANP